MICIISDKILGTLQFCSKKKKQSDELIINVHTDCRVDTPTEADTDMVSIFTDTNIYTNTDSYTFLKIHTDNDSNNSQMV